MNEEKKTESKAEGKDKPDHKKVQTAEGWKRKLLKKIVKPEQ